ncbi:MAG: hypothetical protein V1495_09205 [Pseudomonadota bacterium]
MNRRLRTVRAVLWGFALFSGNAFANPLLDTATSDSLTFPKGDGLAGIQTSYRRSDHFFIGTDRRSTAADGSSLAFDDFILSFRGAYGLTDRMTLWLELPVVYRSEGEKYDAQDQGVGDTTAGVRYLLFGTSEKTQGAFDLNGRFPSGDTGVGFADPATGRKPKLPLGTGCSEIEPGLFLRHRFGKVLSTDLGASYAFRLSALVQYLSTSNIALTASDGTTIYQLPAGNLKIDWGDQLTLRGRVGFEVTPSFHLEAGAVWFHRWPTLVHSFALTQAGNTITSAPQDLESGASRLLSTEPALSLRISRRWRIRASASIPILGDNYPVLPVVESAVGNSYRLEAHYEF